MSEAMFLFLVDLTIKSSIVLGLAWLLVACMRHRSAAERHSVWLMAFAGLLVLPVMLTIGSRFDLRMPDMGIPGESVIERITATIEHEFGNQLSVFSINGSFPEDQSAAASTGVAIPDSQQVDEPVTESDPNLDIMLILSMIYGFIAMLLFVRYVGMRIRVGHRLRSLESLNDSQLMQRLDDVRARLGVSRRILLLRSQQVQTPWTWGLLRPCLVLPRGFRNWSTTQQKNALIHELAHIRRYDHLTGLLLQLCCCVYWFNPIVWFGARRLLLESEKACDDHVIRLGGSASSYAEQLVQLAERIHRNEGNSVWVPAMAHRSSLTPRVHSILDSNKRRSAMSKSRISLFAAVASVMIIPLATLQSQEPIVGLNDPEFQMLLANGPNGSAELERIIDVYVDNGMNDEASATIARFAAGEFGTPDDHGCNFCIEVFSSERMPHQHEHFGVVVDAFNFLEERAAEEQSGETLLNVTLENIAGSGNAHALNRASYFVVRALTLGINEQQSIRIAQFLYERGSVEAARDLASWLYDNESSPHYQSETAKQWVMFLGGEVRRLSTVDRMIFEQLGLERDYTDEEYLPIVKTAPIYPAAAAEERLEGHVIVEFTVSPEGKPKDISIVQSSDDVFIASAIAAAERFRYAPRVVAGTPVSVPGVRNKITYKLDPE